METETHEIGAGEGNRTLDPNLGKGQKAPELPTSASATRPISIPLPALALFNTDRTSNRQQLSTSILTMGCKEITMVRNQETVIRKTIRRQQLREIVPLADSTIYEMEQRGEFPRRFALSPRCVVWDLAEVEAWLASRRSTPIVRAQSPDVRQRRSRPVREPGRVQAGASRAG